jgi:multidrug efflux pump subunit AcrB
VVNAINAQNLILPTGTAKIGAFEYNVALNGSPQTIAELNALPVRTTSAGTIYIRDVAQVHDGFQPQTNIVRHDGQRAVLVNILKYGTASTLDIVERVKAEIPRMQAGLPPELEIKTAVDQSIFVRAAVDGVVHEAILAGCLTAVMILLFLGSWRSTLIIAITIPLAILTSLIALFALGETINIMTLGGLALAVGILVDDATVAIENISQHLEQDKPLDQAILDGAQQIAIPTLVSTLAICIVFVPMFMLSGVARYLFVPMAEAVVFAMLASYVFSRTLVPTLAKYLLRAGVLEHGHPKASRNPFVRLHRAFERGFSRFRAGYHGMLELCMRRPKFFGVLFLAGCVLSMALLPWVGRDFFPSVDAGQFKLHARAKTGTRIEEMARICDLIEIEIRRLIPPAEVATILDNIGLPLSGTNMSYNMSGTIGVADADIQVALNRGHGPTAEYVRLLREKLPEKFPGVMFYVLPSDIVSQILNFGLPAPIDIQIAGRNLAANRAFAAGLYQKLNRIPGIADLRIQQPSDQPKLKVTVDRTKAQQAGYAQIDVARNVLITLSGSFQTTPAFWLNPKNGVSYNLITQMPQYKVNSLQALSNIVVSGQASAGRNILGDFATIERDVEPAVVSHWNVQPVLDIFGSVQGRDLGGVADDINGIVDASLKDLPKGAKLTIRGQMETMTTSFSGLLFGLIFAIVLVYLLMVVNFQSWLDPFIILMALPAALAGIVWMLFVTQTRTSVPALMGAIMSIGLAVANSILLVTFANDRRAEGAGAAAAALEAGYVRLRPVLMTAAAMIIGMIPMALGFGEGGEQNAPLGRAVIGGLLLATVSTLFFVPVVYSVMHRKSLSHDNAS